MQARLGTAAHLCTAIVLELRTDCLWRPYGSYKNPVLGPLWPTTGNTVGATTPFSIRYPAKLSLSANKLCFVSVVYLVVNDPQ